MATNGKAREITIEALKSCTPFARKGFAMTAVQGTVETFGKLPQSYVEDYREQALNNDVMYTVLSYQTPIAWVLRSGKVITPNVKYSNTTTNHQSLCTVYLNRR